MERIEIIYPPCVLVSTLRGRFDYVTLCFCGLLLGFVGDCTITGCYVSPPLMTPEHYLPLLKMLERHYICTCIKLSY